MSFDAEAHIVRELGKFILDKSLYQGFKPVLWSTVEKTALADAEVEYMDHISSTVYVAFNVKKSKNEGPNNAKQIQKPGPKNAKKNKKRGPKNAKKIQKPGPKNAKNQIFPVVPYIFLIFK